MDALSSSPATTIPGLPSPQFKRKRAADDTEGLLDPEAGRPPLQCTQGFVDPEAGRPGFAPMDCTQGFATPPRRKRTATDFSPEAPSGSSGELRRGLRSLLEEKQTATEDPYLALDASMQIPVESHDERVSYSMANVSELVRCRTQLDDYLNQHRVIPDLMRGDDTTAVQRDYRAQNKPATQKKPAAEALKRVGIYVEPLPSFPHEYVPQLAPDTLLPLWPLGMAEPPTWTERLSAAKTRRAETHWDAVRSSLLDIFCYRTPRLRQQCLKVTQLCCRDLHFSADFELGMVHLLIYDAFCKVGKSNVECGLDKASAVSRLHNYKRAFPEGSLQYMPILYSCPSGAHALHLETYVHSVMSVYDPETRLTVPSTNSGEGKECYTRDSAKRLVEVLHRASSKTVAQLCAGKNALAKILRGTAEYVPTKEEFNNSPDL
ncbi:prfA [Symbiodinium sp. CCMP2456]|nr:prfA [Symbiodinium sp. CCMP2456]